MHWKLTAVVWLNDPLFGEVLVGKYGFVWVESGGENVVFASFGHRSMHPVLSFQNFKDWSSTVSYNVGQVEKKDLLRFVRTGLAPSCSTA